MTVLPTDRAPIDAPVPAPPVAAEAPAAPEESAHPRLDRRRQRRRHRFEAALVILAFPFAVAFTLFMLLTASGGSVLRAEEAATSETVRVEGALSVLAADRLVAEGVVVDVTSAVNAQERTEVFYFSRSDRLRAEELARAIGARVVVLGTSPPAGATFVIRVGEDLAP